MCNYHTSRGINNNDCISTITTQLKTEKTICYYEVQFACF